MFNYGPMGGMAAAGEAKGLQQGWNFVDQARDSSQRRKMREMQMAQAAQKMLQENQENMMKNYAMQQYSQKTGAFDEAMFQQHQQQINQLNSQITKLMGWNNKQFVNDYLKAQPEERPNMIAKARTNENLHQGFGIKNPKTIRMTSPEDPNDLRDVQLWAAKYDPKVALMEPEQADRYIKSHMQNGNYITADGHVVHIPSLAKALNIPEVQDANDEEKIAASSSPVVQAKAQQAQQAGVTTTQGQAPITTEAMQIDPEVEKLMAEDPNLTEREAQQMAAGEKGEELPKTEEAAPASSTNMEGLVVKPAIAKRSIHGTRPKTEGIIIHRTASPNAKGSIAWFNDPKNKVGTGAHYVIDKDGTVYQTAPDDAKVYHSKGGWNNKSIGIEVVGQAKGDKYEPLTPQQRDALTKLSVSLADKYGLKPEQIIGHMDADAHKGYAEGQEEAAMVRQAMTGGKVPAGGVQYAQADTTDTGANLPPVQPSAPAAESNVEGQASWLNQPYKGGELIRDKWDLYNQLLGFKDNRPADVRTMDYIARQMGPDATVGDVLSGYQMFKEASKTKSDKTFDWQAQIQAYNGMIDEKVAKGEVKPEEADILKRQNAQTVLRSKRLGTSYTSDIARADAAVKNREAWEKLKNSPGQISQEFLGNLQRNEEMLKRALPEKTRDYLESTASMVERANKIARDIDTNGPDNYMRGNIKGFEQWLAKMAPRKWVDKAEMAKAVDATIGLDTELGMLVSDYLRAQSGTAVNAEEANRLVGGVLTALSSQDPHGTEIALRRFADVNAMKARQQLENVGSRGYAYTALNNLNNLKQAYERYKYEMPGTAEFAKRYGDNQPTKTPDVGMAKKEVVDNPKMDKTPQQPTAAEQTIEWKPISKVITKAELRQKVMGLEDGQTVKIGGKVYRKQGDNLGEVQ